MPRCTISVSPPARSARMYFERRRKASTRAPVNRSARPSGSGQRRSGRWISACRILRPVRTGSSPRRTVSTSGNSGKLVSAPAARTAAAPPAVVTAARRLISGCGSRRKGRTMAQDGDREQGESASRRGSGTTSFGFEEVSEAEKTRRVHEVFSSVARRYDLMNDLMSGGVHRLWKSAMIDWLAPRPGMRVLDVAGGTGDIAFRILDRTKGRAEITVLDLTEAMLVE